MDILKEDIKSLLPNGVFLVDLKEDNRRRMLNCVIDAENPVDLNLTTSVSKDIHKSGILEKS
jgi:ribosome maturation factor RimP